MDVREISERALRPITEPYESEIQRLVAGLVAKPGIPNTAPTRDYITRAMRRLILKTCAGLNPEAMPALAAALTEVDLRATQARTAASLVKSQDRTAFLVGEIERIAAVARGALAKARP